MTPKEYIEKKVLEFDETNPRATLLKGHLYFREEDVKAFFITNIKAGVALGLELAEEAVPDEDEEIGPLEIYRAVARGFNSCRKEILARIKQLKEELV